MEWGSVPDWVEALGTTGAFVATYFLLRHELASRREDERDRAEERSRRLHERARRIVFQPAFPGGKKDIEQQLRIAISNTSDDLFITNIELTVCLSDGRGLATRHLEDMGPREGHDEVVVLPWFDPKEVRWTLRWIDDETGTAWQRDHRNVVRRLVAPAT